MMEEWVARRIDSPHVLKPCLPSRESATISMSSTEFVDGQTLTQWMIDNPKPDLETVRDIVEQIAKGLRAFHRMEMLHQDLRPDNIMIDKTGTVKIIDFGSTRVTGVAEAAPSGDRNDILGTAQYTAPEYFLGEGGSPRSDLFSLGVITYQMLTGSCPMARRSPAHGPVQHFNRLTYRPGRRMATARFRSGSTARSRRAVHPNPLQALRQPFGIPVRSSQSQREISDDTSTPLIERNPLLFWK